MRHATVSEIDLDYKTLDYLLLWGDAEEFEDADDLLAMYDGKDLENQNRILAAEGPLYVIHNFRDILDVICGYSIVYNEKLDVVGYLD